MSDHFYMSFVQVSFSIKLLPDYTCFLKIYSSKVRNKHRTVNERKWSYMNWNCIFIPLICDGTVKENISFLGETNSVPQALGNIVAKHVDYLIHSTLQPMPYYSKNMIQNTNIANIWLL